MTVITYLGNKLRQTNKQTRNIQMPVTPTTPTPAARTSASPEPSRADQDTGRLQARSTERGTSRAPLRSAGSASVAPRPSTDLQRRTVALQMAPASPASSSGSPAASVALDVAPDGALDLGNDMSKLKRVLTQHTDVGRFLPRSSDACLLYTSPSARDRG